MIQLDDKTILREINKNRLLGANTEKIMLDTTVMVYSRLKALDGIMVDIESLDAVEYTYNERTIFVNSIKAPYVVFKTAPKTSDNLDTTAVADLIRIESNRGIYSVRSRNSADVSRVEIAESSEVQMYKIFIHNDTKVDMGVCGSGITIDKQDFERVTSLSIPYTVLKVGDYVGVYELNSYLGTHNRIYGSYGSIREAIKRLKQLDDSIIEKGGAKQYGEEHRVKLGWFEKLNAMAYYIVCDGDKITHTSLIVR